MSPLAIIAITVYFTIGICLGLLAAVMASGGLLQRLFPFVFVVFLWPYLFYDEWKASRE